MRWLDNITDSMDMSLSKLWELVMPTLCDPMDCSLPGSSVDGIVEARILEWVAMLYKGKDIVKRDIDQQHAVDELVKLIESDHPQIVSGQWPVASRQLSANQNL